MLCVQVLLPDLAYSSRDCDCLCFRKSDRVAIGLPSLASRAVEQDYRSL
jgi:hypothetical protein